jgi:hypothetical protein
VQEQIHRTQPSDAVDDLDAAQCIQLEMAFLVAIEVRIVVGDIGAGGEYEAAGATGWIANRLTWLRADDVHDGVN